MTQTHTPNVNLEGDVEVPMTYAERFHFNPKGMTRTHALNIKVSEERRFKSGSGSRYTIVTATAKLQEYDRDGSPLKNERGYPIETYVSINHMVVCGDGTKAEKEYQNTLKSFYAFEGLTELEVSFPRYEENARFDERSGKTYEAIKVPSLDVRSVKGVMEKLSQLEEQVTMLEAIVSQLAGHPVSLPDSTSSASVADDEEAW